MANRFRAVTDLIKPERIESTTTLKGLDYVDVPGSSKRDYRLNFFSYKEVNISVKVSKSLPHGEKQWKERV